jgi:hypothetical protein
MSSDTLGDQILNTLKGEVVKVHHVYDGSDRLIERYEAVANAVHGAKCLRTDYTYDGASTRVVGMKESVSTWDSAWDI